MRSAALVALLACLALVAPLPAAAHVGDTGPVQTLVMDAGPYALAVTMTIPPALPGPLLVALTSERAPAPAAVELRLTRYGSPFPASPTTRLTLSAPLSATTQLDLAGPGTWEVELRAQGDRGQGLARIPVTVAQPPLPPTTIPLAVALGALVISLLAGAAVSAGGRATRGGFAATARILNYVAFAAAVATAIFVWQQFAPVQAVAPAPGTTYGGAPHINLLLASEPQSPVAGSPAVLTLDLRDGATGLAADDLSPHHDALVHLVLIDESGGFFAHMHPARIAPGQFAVTLVPDRPGTYTAYAEIVRHGGGAQVVTSQFAVTGAAAVTPALPPPGERTFERLKVTVQTSPGQLRAGEQAVLALLLSDDAGPMHDVEPWLGMAGHLILRRTDGMLFSHIHAAAPMATPGSTIRYGPELRFVHTFARAGRYHAWFQFRHAGQVVTVPATLEVAP